MKRRSEKRGATVGGDIPEGRSRRRRSGGLDYRPIQSVEEALGAWSLVYRSYLRARLILSNTLKIHLVEAATRDDSLTVAGMIRNEIGATISAYPDAADGLPLDASFPVEMRALRSAGRTLIEVGLLADRRIDLRRTLDAKLELMKWAYFYGHYTSHSDLIVGVHPHHVKFYSRMFGFEQFGEESICPVVNNAPVVGLRLNLAASLVREPMPRGIRHFVTAPVLATDYEGRFTLGSGEWKGTRIDRFLRALRALGSPAARSEALLDG